MAEWRLARTYTRKEPTASLAKGYESGDDRAMMPVPPNPNQGRENLRDSIEAISLKDDSSELSATLLMYSRGAVSRSPGSSTSPPTFDPYALPRAPSEDLAQSSFQVPEASNIAGAMSDAAGLLSRYGMGPAAASLAFSTPFSAYLSALDSFKGSSGPVNGAKNLAASFVQGSAASALGSITAEVLVMTSVVPVTVAVAAGVTAAFAFNAFLPDELQVRPAIDALQARATDFLQTKYDEIKLDLGALERQITNLYVQSW